MWQKGEKLFQHLCRGQKLCLWLEYVYSGAKEEDLISYNFCIAIFIGKIVLQYNAVSYILVGCMVIVPYTEEIALGEAVGEDAINPKATDQ